MSNDVKETIQDFFSAYEQANTLPIIRPMSYDVCSYLLSWAVIILKDLENH